METGLNSHRSDTTVGGHTLDTVVFYIPHLDLGGAEKRLVTIVRGLDRRRFLPVLWHSGASTPLVDEVRERGIDVFTVARTAESFKSWASILRGYRASIFHSFNHRPDCEDLLAAAEADIPVLILSRGNLRHWDTSGRQYDWERVRNDLVRVVVANCQAVRDVCVSVERVPADKVTVIYNGVSCPSSTRSGGLRLELGLSDDVIVLGNVGNLRPIKGQRELLKAFQQLNAEHRKLHLVIAGADRGLGGELASLSRSLQIEDRVTFLGRVKNTDRFYPDLDIYIHSSLSEGMPNAVLEAMAFGRPVVATRVGGVPEVLHHGETGILVEPDDAKALARGIAILLENTEQRRVLGAAARRVIARRFSREAMVRLHEDLYGALVSSRSALRSAALTL